MRAIGIFEVLRELVVGSLVVLYSSSRNFNLEFFHFVLGRKYLVFGIFAPCLVMNTFLNWRFKDLADADKFIGKYYRVKVWSTRLWVVEMGAMLVVRVLSANAYSNLVAEYVFALFALGIDLGLICSMRKIYKCVVSGDPIDPAEIGVEVKVVKSLPAGQEMGSGAFEATVVTEVYAFPTRALKEEQKIVANRNLDVRDYSKRCESERVKREIGGEEEVSVGDINMTDFN